MDFEQDVIATKNDLKEQFIHLLAKTYILTRVVIFDRDLIALWVI
jgi:hypothetical protein